MFFAMYIWRIYWSNATKWTTSINDLLNDTKSLDPIEQKWERQHRYYVNMSVERKSELSRCKNEAMTVEMEDSQIGKLSLHFNNISDMYYDLL